MTTRSPERKLSPPFPALQPRQISLSPPRTPTAAQSVSTCDATALPGAQCTLSPFSPITVGSGAAVPVTATVSVPNNAAAGSYNIKINSQDATGEPAHSWPIALTVQDFAFTPVTPPTQTVGAGQSAIYNLSVMPVGTAFSSPVSLSCAGAPANSTCSFTPNPVTPGSAAAAVVMTIATSATALPGNFHYYGYRCVRFALAFDHALTHHSQ